MRHWVLGAVLGLVMTACGSPGQGGQTDGGDPPDEVTRTTAVIGPDGGELALDGATLVFPPGALGADTEITLEHDPAAPDTALSGTWRIQPAGLVLGNPVALRLPAEGLPGDVALSWRRHPAFGEGHDLIPTALQGPEAVAYLYYLDEGYLTPTQGHGEVLYRSRYRLYDHPQGLMLEPNDAWVYNDWISVGGGSTMSGTVQAASELVRAGPLHPGADTACLGLVYNDAPYWGCQPIVTPSYLRAEPGGSSEQGFAMVSVEASNLTPVAPESEYWLVSNNVLLAITPTSGQDLIAGGLPAGSTGGTLALTAWQATDPAGGDRTWVFETNPTTPGDASRRHLSGYAELPALAISVGGQASAEAPLVPLADDDAMAFDFDLLAWEARLPGLAAKGVKIDVYGTWGRYYTSPEGGVPLATALGYGRDFDGQITLSMPLSPLPALEERVGINIWDQGYSTVYMDLSRAEVEAGGLPAPAVGLPGSLDLNDTVIPVDQTSLPEVSQSDGLHLTWAPVSSDGPVHYGVQCVVEGGGSSVTLASVGTAAEVRFPAVLLPGAYGSTHSYCRVEASTWDRAPRPLANRYTATRVYFFRVVP